ncbi:MAG: CHAT domain-containing protein [Acidobacteriota bacterium]|nr:CHAT domain-containing protein [Acidobacteriota bacterium]
MKRYYGELLLSLSGRWNVHAFWFDWRKDLELAAVELDARIRDWFGDKAPVHIVAHSMGGVVARTFIKKYPGRWKAMWDKQGGGKSGGRLVMLGTPNHGSFVIPQVITGVEGLVRKLALLDLRHNRRDLLETLNTFVGSYQMLPSPLVIPNIAPLYDAGTYGDLNVPQRHLDCARRHHEMLSDCVDADRMIYIAGYNQPTFSGVADWKKLNSTAGYELTLDGDGRVTHELGLLGSDEKGNVPTYYIEEEHGALVENPRILGALDALLETGATGSLLKAIPISRGAELGSAARLKSAREQLEKAQREDEARLLISLRRMETRSASPPGRVDSGQRVSPEERQAEENLTRGFLGARARGREDEAPIEVEPVRIEIGLVYGGIESINYQAIKSTQGNVIDAISVGHYIGVRPQDAEGALDCAISHALAGVGTRNDNKLPKAEWLLTQYTERGIIRGELGQPFFITDPRAVNGKRGGARDRVIALAGMDVPGRFGMPELTVLARELCWSLGRMNKLHLATVLIGSGNGNLSVGDAVAAWMSGVKRALASARDDKRNRRLRIRRVTFVELDPRKIREIQDAILNEQRRRTELEIIYQPWSERKLNALRKAELQKDRADWERRRLIKDKSNAAVPTRVTLSLERETYRFGAITDDASIPEREVTLDPNLVMSVNNQLAGELSPLMQREWGQVLEQLLMPNDLRQKLYSNAPLVMMLDATTARVHWEMVAQPNFSASGSIGAVNSDYTDCFLGTSRGLTRQLRTTFAPPPEPPPPPRRVLQALVIADPAADDPLPGAQAEGVEIADLFESYNSVYEDTSDDNRIQVTRLFGPLEATRENVMRELLLRSYDVLHFAGHCSYDPEDPSASGWIFSHRERLAANELSRIDRIPKFVFSNACESGITPDRSQERSVDLAPSFAEAFFKRGVANFVCTAWPVDDGAARQFALTLYGGLIGLEPVAGQPGRYQRAAPKLMHVAMHEARLSVAAMPNGVTTWGAYQHYGNPYLQLFNPPKKALHVNEINKFVNTESRARQKKLGQRASTRRRSS